MGFRVNFSKQYGCGAYYSLTNYKRIVIPVIPIPTRFIGVLGTPRNSSTRCSDTYIRASVTVCLSGIRVRQGFGCQELREKRLRADHEF